MSFSDTRIDLERTLIARLPDGVNQEDLPAGPDLLAKLSSVALRERAYTLEPYPLLGLMARLTEWDRQELFTRTLADEPQQTRRFCLWRLGNAFMDFGHYGLAAGAFVQGALTERAHELTRATLLVKAGAAGTSGSLGSAIEFFLAAGSALLEHRNAEAPAAVELARLVAHYRAARYHLFLDAFGPAEQSVDRMVDVLGNGIGSLLGLRSDAAHLPELLLLRARIARRRFEMTASGQIADALDLLDQAADGPEQSIFLSEPFSHHLAFQRAAALRVMGDVEQAATQANLACRALSGVGLDGAAAWVERTWTTANRYRLGHMLCIGGEIALDSRDTARAMRLIEAASLCWTDPYYARGLSRARRLQAIALMREGHQWSEASRHLTESLAHARGRSLVSEAQAVACKIALHRTLQHAQRRQEYEARLREIREAMREHWAVHRSLDALAEGRPAPTARPARTFEPVRELAAQKGLWGEDPAFLNSLNRALACAKTNPDVIFIDGERGTGKTELARFIHDHGPRAKGPFVKIALATIPEHTAESQLFGHVKGAFTSADRTKMGLIQEADGGTLFLDDITDANHEVQRKLINVIQDRRIRPMGANREVFVDFCLVCATNKDIQAEVRAGRFREDLCDRIFGNQIHVPPLRERGRDVVLIGQKVLEYNLNKYRESYPSLFESVKALTTQTWDEICGYHLGGNIRQLSKLIEGIVVTLAAELTAGEELSRLVSSTGEISREFAHSAIEQARLARAPAMERVLVDTIPRPTGAPSASNGTRYLHAAIHLTPADVTAIDAGMRFRSVRALAAHLKQISPGYSGTPQAIEKLLARHQEFRPLLDAIRGRAE